MAEGSIIVVTHSKRMASIILRPKSKYWCACFRDCNGRQRRESTKETDRKTALRIAEHYEKAAGRAKTVKHIREVTENLIKEFYSEQEPSATPSPTVHKCAQRWLERRRQVVSRATFEVYAKSVVKLIEFLGQAAQESISLVSGDTLAEFHRHVGSEVSARTANFDLKIVKAIFKAAKAEGYLEKNPAELLQSRGDLGELVQRRPFTVDELKMVLGRADEEWKSLIKFGLYTGQRLGDLAMLRWENLDLPLSFKKIRLRMS